MERREHLITVTRDLILEQGIQAASMSKIGKLSKVSMGSIYNMFESKDDLINSVFCYCAKQFVVFNEDNFHISATSFKEAIFSALKQYIHNALAHPKDFQFADMYRLSPLVKRNAFIINSQVRYGDYTLDEAMAAKLMKEMPVVMISDIVFGIINRSIHSHIVGAIELDETRIDQLIIITWDALSKQ